MGAVRYERRLWTATGRIHFLRRHYPDQVQGDPKLRFASISAGDAPQRPCFYVRIQYSGFVRFVKGAAVFFLPAPHKPQPAVHHILVKSRAEQLPAGQIWNAIFRFPTRNPPEFYICFQVFPLVRSFGFVYD